MVTGEVGGGGRKGEGGEVVRGQNGGSEREERGPACAHASLPEKGKIRTRHTKPRSSRVTVHDGTAATLRKAGREVADDMCTKQNLVRVFWRATQHVLLPFSHVSSRPHRRSPTQVGAAEM